MGTPGWGRTTEGPREKEALARAPPSRPQEWYGPGRVKGPEGEAAGEAAGAMGLRAGGALGRAGPGRGAPGGPAPGGGEGAQGGSIHSGCIAAVHNVPLRVLIRPLPSVLDPAKVQSLVDTIRVRPRGGHPPEGGRRRGQVALDARGGWFLAPSGHCVCCVSLSNWLGLPEPLSPPKVTIAHRERFAGAQE